MEQYADIIIDLSVKNVDRIFQYQIPAHLREAVKPGVQVNVPFGKGDTASSSGSRRRRTTTRKR